MQPTGRPEYLLCFSHLPDHHPPTFTCPHDSALTAEGATTPLSRGDHDGNIWFGPVVFTFLTRTGSLPSGLTIQISKWRYLRSDMKTILLPSGDQEAL